MCEMVRSRAFSHHASYGATTRSQTNPKARKCPNPFRYPGDGGACENGFTAYTEDSFTTSNGKVISGVRGCCTSLNQLKRKVTVATKAADAQSTMSLLPNDGTKTALADSIKQGTKELKEYIAAEHPPKALLKLVQGFQAEAGAKLATKRDDMFNDMMAQAQKMENSGQIPQSGSVPVQPASARTWGDTLGDWSLKAAKVGWTAAKAIGSTALAVGKVVLSAAWKGMKYLWEHRDFIKVWTMKVANFILSHPLLVKAILKLFSGLKAAVCQRLSPHIVTIIPPPPPQGFWQMLAFGWKLLSEKWGWLYDLGRTALLEAVMNMDPAWAKTTLKWAITAGAAGAITSGFLAPAGLVAGALTFLGGPVVDAVLDYLLPVLQLYLKAKLAMENVQELIHLVTGDCVSYEFAKRGASEEEMKKLAASMSDYESKRTSGSMTAKAMMGAILIGYHRAKHRAKYMSSMMRRRRQVSRMHHSVPY